MNFIHPHQRFRNANQQTSRRSNEIAGTRTDNLYIKQSTSATSWHRYQTQSRQPRLKGNPWWEDASPVWVSPRYNLQRSRHYGMPETVSGCHTQLRINCTRKHPVQTLSNSVACHQCTLCHCISFVKALRLLLTCQCKTEQPPAITLQPTANGHDTA